LYKRLFSSCVSLLGNLFPAPADHPHLAQAAAVSEVARDLHHHYSSTSMSELFSRLEASITWSDPASPLLSCFHRFPGTLIIDSVTPFTIPHIVITEPPIWDYNPYVNMHNSTQTPQDAGWGQSLVVPSPVVDFVNLPEDPPCELGESTSGYSVIAQYAESEGESESPSEGSVFGSPVSTVLQTPCLLTPIDEEEEFDLIMFASSPPRDSYLSSAIGDDSPLAETPEEAPEDAGMYCDDEDDDLPPLDGWYQDIAARSGYILST
jgi:hypothetical protein